MAKTVNKRSLDKAILDSKTLEKKALQIAENQLKKSKAILVQDFYKHKVSKEISAGPNAKNSSGTLGGYGNLFSFIGFPSGANPVEVWVSIIQNKIKIVKMRKTIDKDLIFSFEVNSISNKDMMQARMPWEGGRSWIDAIERGISGFSFYVSKSLGRSGGGIQSNNQIRGGNYSPVAYWSKMWAKFIANLNN